MMLEFVNLSSFILGSQPRERGKSASDLFSILVAMAANEYEHLFSSRGKNEFAYYFSRILGYCNTKRLDEVVVNPYEPDKWRNSYRRMTKKIKDIIRDINAAGEDMNISYIANIAISIGVKVDFVDKHEKAFFEIGTYTTYPAWDYNDLFITTFDLN